jgi:hypothetical protein
VVAVAVSSVVDAVVFLVEVVVSVGVEVTVGAQASKGEDLW